MEDLFTYDEIKKFLMFNLILGVVISAVVGIIAVITGEFNSFLKNILWTFFSLILHSLGIMAVSWVTERIKNNKLALFSNSFFFLIIIDFIISVLYIWDVVKSSTYERFFSSFVLFSLSALHIDLINFAKNKRSYLDILIYSNYIFIVLVYIMLEFLIFTPSNHINTWFYKLLAIFSIIDSTLTVLILIFYKIYRQEWIREQKILNPNFEPPRTSAGIIIIFIILFLFLLFNIIISFVFWSISNLF